MATVIRAVRPPEESARDFAYRVLALYINELFFLPGERLAEADVAAQLGVSRTPVHDTFLRLEREQLLCAGARGACVPLLRPDSIRQLAWMYRTTGLAVLGRVFNQRPGRAAMEPLERCAAAEDALLAAGDLAGAPRRLWAFGGEVYRLAGCLPAYRALSTAGPDLYRLYRLEESPFVWRYLAEQHAALVQALALRRHEEACAALERQFDLVEPMLARCQRRYPRYFA